MVRCVSSTPYCAPFRKSSIGTPPNVVLTPDSVHSRRREFEFPFPFPFPFKLKLASAPWSTSGGPGVVGVDGIDGVDGVDGADWADWVLSSLGHGVSFGAL